MPASGNLFSNMPADVSISVPEEPPLPIGGDALDQRLQPAPTFTATSCPHCEQVFEVQIDFEEIKDSFEFERLKKRELEAQKEAYKLEIGRFQEEINSLKETLANLCNQLAQAQVENLRSKQSSIEQDSYIKQLKDHLRQSENELHHLAYDFELALSKLAEAGSGQQRSAAAAFGPDTFSSGTAKRIARGDSVPRPTSAASAASPGAASAVPRLGEVPDGGSPVPHTPGGPPAPAAAPPAPAPAQGQRGDLLGNLSAAVQQAGGTPERTYPPPPRTGQVEFDTQGSHRDRYRQRLINFYAVHNPGKLGEVDAILREFEGHEEEMLVMLARKYCTPPITDHPTGAAPRHSRPSSGFDSFGGPPSAGDRPSGAQHLQTAPVSPPESDPLLRQVAPWTLQMRNARRGGS
eukprot:TRINITY_DN1319_c4_g1_i1.p1 TRINITY_DN1319_c4_g1~~TRINITY_DN1319_c4_g1_i1.p1  ORF type:complete len:436 (+),score=142.09 TRINITY_DN1319_c4_g1_i1:91-1308(+)